ncbi:mechanosensitive ion channel domain-containing protein [Aminivibrio sp.]|jgi:hypothetical protein|uniref:mechanosensitive ion channel family protein n=1 Tax=Aminivibrio sp. TaxID=1872489 RepID=UPI001A42A330|nr:mechanosensitive ion channel domain-containing protein [Aminivibrio sp.]MBL3538096.1 mechanosensitive ion channel [Aminivibrio sp.]
MRQYLPTAAIRKHLVVPGLVAMLGMVLIAALPYAEAKLAPAAFRILLRTAKIGLVASMTWLALGGVSLFEIYFRNRFDISAADNLKARKIQTQFILFKRLLVILILFLSVSIALLSIDDFRRIGTSLLASVGVAGIIVGISAQRTVGTFLAGIHLAIAEPIRIDDVVVAEGEWGRVEEITFTFVVLRLWDSRRLVLPTTYFLEKPFQNWTRVSADIIGTAFFHVDFSADVEQIREFFYTVLGTTPLWDGKAKALQVTDCTPRSMEVRALMSAANSGVAWDLRCHVRERMMEWLRLEHPDWLPRARAEVNGRGEKPIPWSAPERDRNDADSPEIV